jgi:hypothetical protein
MAVAFQKFQCFSEHLSEKVHNLDTDTLKIALSNTGPSAANDDTLSDITEISAGSGYTAGGVDTTNSTSRAAGTTSIVPVDASISASGGTIGPFQYVILYNDTATNDELIGFWNLGTTYTIPDGGTFIFDFAATLFTVA